MSNQIALRQSATDELVNWSQNMAHSDILPAQYRHKPANLMFAAEYADSLGISRIHALTSISVIEGKPSANADLLAGMVRRAGHKLRVWDEGDKAVAELIRNDDPDFTHHFEFSMKDAQLAGLANKSNWKKYPKAMRQARAITGVIRQGAQDAMAGMVYTPEELGAEVDESGNVLRHEATIMQQPQQQYQQPQQQQVPQRAQHVPQQASTPQQAQQAQQRTENATNALDEALGRVQEQVPEAQVVEATVVQGSGQADFPRDEHGYPTQLATDDEMEDLRLFQIVENEVKGAADRPALQAAHQKHYHTFTGQHAVAFVEALNVRVAELNNQPVAQ